MDDTQAQETTQIKAPRVSSTSTRRDLSIAIAEEHHLPQAQAYAIIDTTLQALLANLVENGHLELRGFGVFEVVERKGRKGRNPKKPDEEIWIKPCKTVKFRVSRLLREDLQKAKSARTPRSAN